MPDEALRSVRRAIGLNPRVPEYYLIPMVDAFISLGRPQEALSICDQIINRRPAWIMAHILRILALDGLEAADEVREAVRRLRETSPGFTIERWRKMIYYPNRPDILALAARLEAAGLPR
jgi:hypothetical protein